MGNKGEIVADEVIRHSRPFLLKLTLQPLAGMFLKPVEAKFA